MDLLIRTPRPRPTESLLGYILRVSEENGYESPTGMMASSGAGGVKGNLVYPVLENLAAVLGCPISNLHRIRNKDDGSKGLLMLGKKIGSQFGSNQLRLRRPVLCPQCVVEDGFIDACWDMEVMAACPKHGRIGISKCHVCDEPLAYQRRGLLKCSCGASLAASPTMEASVGICELMSVVKAKAHGDSVLSLKNESGLPLQHLEPMSLAAFCEMLENLARHALSSRRGIAQIDPFLVAENLSDILTNWPHGYHAFLRKIDAKDDARVADTTRLKARYFKFYSSMFTRGSKATEYRFLQQEFVRYGNDVLDDCAVPTNIAKNVGIERRWISKAALCTLLGITAPTLNRLLKNFDIPSKVILAGNIKRYLFDVSGLDKSISEEIDLIDHAEAAQFLGVPRQLLYHFRKSGLLKIANPAMREKGSYSQRDIENFRTDLFDLADTINEASLDVTKTISLYSILNDMKFGSIALKTNVVASYLSGELRAIGKIGMTTRDILFDKMHIKNLAQIARLSRSAGTCSYADAGKLIDSSPGAIPGLCKLGYLEVKMERNAANKKIKIQSTENFAREWASLKTLSSSTGTTARRLRRVAIQNNVFVLDAPHSGSHSSQVTSFVRRHDSDGLLECLRTDFVKFGCVSSAIVSTRRQVKM